MCKKAKTQGRIQREKFYNPAITPTLTSSGIANFVDSTHELNTEMRAKDTYNSNQRDRTHGCNENTNYALLAIQVENSCRGISQTTLQLADKVRSLKGKSKRLAGLVSDTEG